MVPDEVLSEARARIIWGESPSSVREFLLSNGISESVADAKLKDFSLERNQELRNIGVRNILIGIVLTVSASITFYLAIRIGSASYGISRLVAVILLVGVYGLWRLLKGVVYLVRPQSEHKSIPDITESESLE